MSWGLLVGLICALAYVAIVAANRRAELLRMESSRDEVRRAKRKGSHRARLQYPHVDLSMCAGCGTCISACPEEGVLELLHGQAVVAHGARCVGHGRCAVECPLGAIQVTLGDLEDRRDIPALKENLEVPGVDGLFLGGELTGYALIRTAIAHGTAIAQEVGRRIAALGGSGDAYDLCIVGAGPAGLACSLQARAEGLHFVTIERETLGGTVSKYPRRKLVMTQPVELPLHGALDHKSYSKEELMELWEVVAEREDLPIQQGITFEGIERNGHDFLSVKTSSGDIHARNVCLALGRRGTPRRLGVSGEELAKVAYGLIDAQSYRGRRVLVVGGGDSAVEAALGLAAQPGNEVTLSYRKHAFSRLKARNEARIDAAAQEGRVAILFNSQVLRIESDRVHLAVESAEAPSESVALGNDDVFVMIGGTLPFPLLEETGVSFDPADRPPPVDVTGGGRGSQRALVTALALALGAFAWGLAFSSYYGLPLPQRPGSLLHRWLRPGAGIGLASGVSAAALVLANLTYLLRRSPRSPIRLGSLQAWMTMHVATGVLALVLALLHGAMTPRNTVGGHALLALAILVVSGGIGRYFYSFVPHAANGRELELDEVRGRLASLSSEWDRRHLSFGEHVRERVEGLTASGTWRGSFLSRIWTLLRLQSRMRGVMAELRAEAVAEGIPPEKASELFTLARRAQRTALMAARYEHLRGLLATWRYVHRWVALLMVLLVVAHVVAAFLYAGVAP